MSERTEHMFGPAIAAERHMYQDLEQQIFAHRQAAAEALELVGVGEWVNDYIKESAVERHRSLTTLNEVYGTKLYRYYMANFLQPLRLSAKEKFQSYAELEDTAIYWFGLTENLEVALSNIGHDFGEAEIVPYTDWHHEVVTPRINNWVEDSAAGTRLFQLAQHENLYIKSLQWGAYAQSVGLYALEEKLFNQFEGAGGAEVDSIMTAIEGNSVVRLNRHAEEHGIDNRITDKLATRAFAYTPDLTIQASNYLNRLSTHPSNPA